jgi:hypothetical protein
MFINHGSNKYDNCYDVSEYMALTAPSSNKLGHVRHLAHPFLFKSFANRENYGTQT